MPIHDLSREQIQQGRQVVSANLCPDVGDVIAPDLIGRINHELPVKAIRDVDSINSSLHVGMTNGLLSDQPHILYQTNALKAASCHALGAHQAHDAHARDCPAPYADDPHAGHVLGGHTISALRARHKPT